MEPLIKWILTVITIIIILALSIIAATIWASWKIFGIDCFFIPFCYWILTRDD